jgi:predicted CoA-binding protein
MNNDSRETCDALQVLSEVSTVLLIDWPHVGVPRALLESGFRVFGYSPDQYSNAELAAERPADEIATVYPPQDLSEKNFLVFRKRDSPLRQVDAVVVYRPAEEIPAIVMKHLLPLHARVLWLQPPIDSRDAAALAAEHHLHFVQGVDVATTARMANRG